MPITHKQVNLFDSEAVFLLHQVNCRGVMGSGIAKQVRERYPEVYEAYRALCDGCDTPSDLLGLIDPEPIADGQWIVNCFTQDDYGRNCRHTDYEALRSALNYVAGIAGCYCLLTHYQDDLPLIAIPYKMGCDRGGGDWKNVVEPMIKEILGNYNTVICHLEPVKEVCTL